MSELNAGSHAPDVVNVVIEIRKGERNKYEMDKETGFLTLDRVTPVAMGYPADYGFVPNTLCKDGDPLDAFLIVDESVPHRVVVPSRPIGVLHMVDAGEDDEKLICVPAEDVTQEWLTDIDQLGPSFKKSIEHYYSHYKDWKNDWNGEDVHFKGWGGNDEARQVIQDSIHRYNEAD